MLSILKYGYKATKPRIQTANTKSLQAYRKQMHEARIKSHQQAVKYLNRIEDQFLDRHKKEMKEKHFDNECQFRAKISRNSYILFQSLQKNKSKHQETLQRMEKFIREEEIKRINRDRIRKILEYESANFWLQGEEISQKFISDRVLPEYIGSTQYYHKLHSEALAYDELDFDMLHKLSSNEQSVQHKNKMLIPIYKEVLTIMREVKFTDEEKAERQFAEAQIKLKKRYGGDETSYKQEFNKLKEQHDKKLVSLKQRQSNQETKREYFKSKLKNLILLLKKWKEYTDVLGMTSAEVLNIIETSKNESEIAERRRILEKDIEKKRDKTFVNVVEEDTEDEQISLQKFLEKKSTSSPIETGSSAPDFNSELASLLEKQRSIFNQISSELKQKEEQLESEFKSLPNLTEGIEQKLTLEDTIKIDEGFLKPSETTTSIEVLKEQFASDPSMKELLDIAGELTIDYPKLFKKVWDTQIL